MTPSDETPPHRIEVGLAPAALDLVTRAAALQGQSVSDFVAAAAQSTARRVIDDAQLLSLSPDDQRIFAAAVANPPAPTEALVRSADAYRNLVRESR